MSPTVARWTIGEASSDNDSQITCHIQAHDLEDSEEIEDSVIIKFDEEKKKITKGKLSGDLPWDRSYGNYVSIKIDNNSIKSDNNEKPAIKFNIPVLVLHSVPLMSWWLDSYEASGLLLSVICHLSFSHE